MARPRLKVDRDKLKELCSKGMTNSEIASELGVSVDTLERRYHNDLIRGKEKCKGSLRRKQFEVAEAGNVTMLIWLGKQLLGQKDQVSHSGDVGVTMRREEVLAKLTAGSGKDRSELPRESE